jgi:hypothetical protein
VVKEARRMGIFPSVHKPVRGNVISDAGNLKVLFGVLSTIVVGEVGR